MSYTLHRILVRASLAAAVLPIFVTASAQPKPDYVQALWAYAGSWNIDTQHFDTPYGKAGHETSMLRNECWKSGQYVACRQIVDGASKGLLVFTCSDEHHCSSYPIPPDGGAPGSGKLYIEGNTWTFPWSSTEHGKTTWFRVVNVWSTPDSIEFRQEFSADQKHWALMASGHETRVPLGRMPTDPLPRNTK